MGPGCTSRATSKGMGRVSSSSSCSSSAPTNHISEKQF